MALANKTHLVLLILYSIIAVLAMWGLVSQSDNFARVPIAIWTSIGAVSACGAMLEILIIIRTRSALRMMKDQIKRLSENAQVGLVMLEDQWPVEGLASILNEYLTLLHQKMEAILQQQRELDLLISAGTADQQNTEAMIRSISDAVVVVNAFGELILANTLAEKLFDIDIKRDKLKPVFDVIKDEKLQTFLMPERWRGVEPIKIEYEREIDGKVHTFNVTFSPVYINRDELWAIVMTLDDITHDRELAEMKADFVNLVSHELRTPLSSIKAYTEMLIEGEINTYEGRMEFYQTIADEADRLNGFIENILNLSKIESGMPVNFSEIDLNSELEKAYQLVQCLAKKKSVLLDYHPLDANVKVWADGDLLRQAVLNLLSNAIKYTDSGGSVSFSVSLDGKGEYYFICVEDTGRGMTRDEAEKIFDKFYRAQSNSEGISGTGLGLTLVKKVVEDIHNGKIELESKLGEGTKFKLILPINPQLNSDKLQQTARSEEKVRI